MWIDDDILERCAEPLAHVCFVPESAIVVLGSSNVAEAEVELERCAEAKIPVLRRYGGGGTVLLHGGCVVVSVGTWVKQAYQNKLYFNLMNQALIDCLGEKWPQLADLSQRGLSDIVIGDKKVAGTSLFRSRNYLLYQASLLVEPRIDLVSRVLKHPTKEPDYRKGRGHGTFMSGMSEIVASASTAECLAQLSARVAERVKASLGDEACEPFPEQFPGLLARARTGRLAAQSNPSDRQRSKS